MEDTRQSRRLLEKMSNKTDDKDDWEEEDTFLDEYHRQKELKKAAKATEAAFAKSSFGIVSTMERMSSANDYIAKALESSPQGWMITSINQTVNNPISYQDIQIAPPYGPEAEVNIKVSDPQLIATLHHAMRGYYQ